MADPFAPSAKDRFKTAFGLIHIALVLIAAVSFVTSVVQSGEQPIKYETMTVISFAMGSSYTGSDPVIRVRDETGLEYPVQAPADIGESCAVGDNIAIIKQGINLKVGPEACAVQVATP